MRGTNLYGTRLSEDELVTYLGEIIPGVTKRRISSWRSKELLPAFDIHGKGGGRGRGRQVSYWSQGGKIIEQAVAVHEALSFYPSAEEAYWPLWLFGYEINVERARKKLLEEIAAAREVLAEGDGSSHSLEDYFFDRAYDLFEALQVCDRDSAKEFTFEQIERFVQTLANHAYDPDDPPSIEWQFVREHFLLPVIHERVTNLSLDELEQLRKDYRHVIDAVSLLVSSFPSFPSRFPQKYWVGGNVGVFFVLFDLAFRRAGYSDFIDLHFPRLSSYIHQELEKRGAAERLDRTGLNAD